MLDRLKLAEGWTSLFLLFVMLTCVALSISSARWTDGLATPKEIRDKLLLSAGQPSAFRYQRRIKELFDPNDLGDTYYRTLDEPE